MAYDENLAERIRAVMAERHDVTEKRMFGGLAFLIGGNMAVAASRQGGLMTRCDRAATDDHIVDGAEPMIMRGRPMSGWLRVPDDRIADDGELARWVRVGTDAAASLPRK